MYFLLSGCNNPDILSIIYLGKKILNILTTLIPIGVVLFITIDILKIVLSADSDKSIKDNQKLIIKRLIYSVLIFFAPTIINVIMTTLTEAGINSDYNTCIVNANKKTIAIKRNEQETEDKQKEEQRQKELEEKRKENIAISGSRGDGFSSTGGGFGGSSGSGSNSDNNEGESGSSSNENNGSEESGNLYQNLASKMISIASKEVGYAASNDYNKYAKEIAPNIDGQPWCAIFVTWVAKKTSVSNTNLYSDVIEKEKPIQNYASAVNSIYTFKNNSNLQFYYSNHYGGNYTPKKGDYIYFNWSKNWDKRIYSGMHISNSHVGLVEYVSGNTVYTIEGNSGNDTVIKGNYQLNSASIMGYGSWYQ